MFSSKIVLHFLFVFLSPPVNIPIFPFITPTCTSCSFDCGTIFISSLCFLDWCSTGCRTYRNSVVHKLHFSSHSSHSSHWSPPGSRTRYQINCHHTLSFQNTVGRPCDFFWVGGKSPNRQSLVTEKPWNTNGKRWENNKNNFTHFTAIVKTNQDKIIE